MMLTLGKVSAIVGIGKKSLVKACEKGRLNAVRVSGGWKISEDELRRFQAEGYLNPDNPNHLEVKDDDQTT